MADELKYEYITLPPIEESQEEGPESVDLCKTLAEYASIGWSLYAIPSDGRIILQKEAETH